MRVLGRAKWLQLIGAVIIVRIIYKLDFARFLACFENARALPIALSFLLLLLFIAAKSARWQQFLVMQKIDYPLCSAFGAYLVGMFFSAVTPGHLGDFAKVFYLEKDAGVSHFRAFSSVLADRLCDLLTLVILAFFFMHMEIFPPAYRIPCQVAGWLLLAFVAVLFHRPSAKRIYAALRPLPLLGSYVARIKPLIEDFYSSFAEFLSPNLIRPIALTALAYTLLFSHAYFLARGLNIDITFAEVVCFTVLGNIAAMIPVSLGGLGPREQVMKELFTRVLDRGRPLTSALLAQLSAEAISFSLSFYGMFLITTGIAGYIAWLKNPINRESVVRLASDLRGRGVVAVQEA